ncbi:MAG: type II toxin-antitoxin system VapC family toxin [Terriglobia bacterium]
MSGVVVDASVALAWCFPDEASEYADGVLVALQGQAIVVPAVWGLEIANAMLAGERRKRLKQPEILRFVALLEGLAIVQDGQSVRESVSNVLPLARDNGLSAYDAAYLELSIRHGVPLATLDAKLRQAAQRAGVKIFGGETA